MTYFTRRLKERNRLMVDSTTTVGSSIFNTHCVTGDVRKSYCCLIL